MKALVTVILPYHLTKKRSKCVFRPQQKVTQVSLYLRSFKVQIYNIVEWKTMQGVSIANDVCLQQILKNLPNSSCVARCLGEAWGFFASVLWPRRDLLGRIIMEINLVEFHIYVCVSPTDANENGGSSLEDLRATYHVQHCVPQRTVENQYCNLMNLRGCLLKG